MKTSYLSLVIAAGLIITLSACKKDAIQQHGTGTLPEADVYVAGFVGPQSQAAYWKNGSLTQLEQDISVLSYARSIAVNANGVYAVGAKQSPSGMNAVLWFNGAATVLSDPSMLADAYSVALNGSDVYVAGYQSLNGVSQAVLWKNGTAALLPSGRMANAVTISGSDVYVAGSTTDGAAAYWKNGQLVTLSGGFSASVIAVNGSDIYIAGMTATSSVVVWKNGTVTQLVYGPANATIGAVTGIAVSGNNLYVAGAMPNGDAGSVPTLWTNDTPQTLPVPANLSSNPSNNLATGVAVYGTDVYTAGEVNNNPAQQWESFYWKNGGTPVQLQGNGNLAAAYAIAVVPKSN